jgi:ATP-binding protein involved in chromosome partitioning
VIENMSYFVCPHCGEETPIFGTGGGYEAAATLGVPLLGRIPLQTTLREGGDQGRPVVVAEPESPAGEALIGAARELARVSRTVVRKPLTLSVAGGGGAETHAAHAGHAHAHEH